MSNIQKTLDSLQPYVISIRYLEGMVLVDVVFKEGWTIPEEKNIEKVKGEEGMNYYMIYSQVKGVGLDELLDYVDKTIKFNLDREKKHELLRDKVNELKEVFKKNSLNNLKRLKFTFGDEELLPNINDLDNEIEKPTEPIINKKESIPVNEEIIEEEIVENHKTPLTYLDENGNVIEMTPEEKEMILEEQRAEKNRKIIANKKQMANITKKVGKVELPPKNKVQVTSEGSECECGPDQYCNKCIEKKGL